MVSPFVLTRMAALPIFGLVGPGVSNATIMPVAAHHLRRAAATANHPDGRSPQRAADGLKEAPDNVADTLAESLWQPETRKRCHTGKSQLFGIEPIF
jgi:hypothetical protein